MDDGSFSLLERGYQLTPRFRQCFLRSTQIVLGLAGALVALIATEDWWRGELMPRSGSQLSSEILLIVPTAILALAGFLFGIARILPVTAKPDGLFQRTLAGEPLRVPWSTVTRVTPKSFSGVPSLLIWSSASRRALVLFTSCLDRREVYENLSQLAGPGHMLTKYFAPKPAPNA